MWEITQTDSHGMPVGNGNYCATSASYNSYGALTPDNWLIITNVELGGTFTFVARGQDPSWSDEVFGVFVSTTQLIVPGTDPVIVEGVTNPYTLTGLTPETPYVWQVQGINSSCTGDIAWSEKAYFTTPELTTITQTIELNTGANWVSFVVETDLATLKDALRDALPGTVINVKNQTQFATCRNGRWSGTLKTLDLTSMYMITVANNAEISLEGMPIDAATQPVAINSGINWIAYPLLQSMTPTIIFPDFAVNGDMVKNQTQFTSYKNGRWSGTLKKLEPGKGYMYNSAATESRVFTFPINK